MGFLISRKIATIFAGFSGVGVITTILSLAAIYFFLEVLKTPLILTYSVIYFVTILLSYLLNSYFIFKTPYTYKKAIKYFLIYIGGMLLGILMLWIFEKTLPFDPYILAYLVLPITTLWNFILVYKLFKPIQ